MKRFFGVLLVLSLFGGSIVSASEPASVVLVKAYEYDALAGIYELIQEGSAVVLDNETVVTNAHVVTDEEHQPSYHYEICKTVLLNKPPKCFAAGHVKNLSIDHDLAILTFEPQENLQAVSLATQSPLLGDDVKVLGYPANGGATITQTEGKVSGFEEELIKIDANLDSGNSGGGAFNAAGELIGIPTFVSVGYTTLGYVVPVEHITALLESREIVASSTIDSQFVTYLQAHQTMMTADRIVTPSYTFSGFGRMGYEVSNYYHTTHDHGPEKLELTDAREKTTITIATYAKEGDVSWKKNNIHKKDYYEDEFDVILSKQITRGGRTRDASFLSGIEGEPNFKQLVFIDRSGEEGLTYVITSIDTNDTAFIDAIVLFLTQLTDINTNEGVHSILDFLDGIVDGLDETVASAYGFDEYGSAQAEFILENDALINNIVSVLMHESDSGFDEITYAEFGEGVTYLLGEYGFADMEGIRMGTPFLHRNQHGLLVYIHPMFYDEFDVELTMYTVSFLLQDNGSVFQFTINMYVQDQGDLETMMHYIDGLSTGHDFDHPFSGLGVEEDAINTSTNIQPFLDQ